MDGLLHRDMIFGLSNFKVAGQHGMENTPASILDSKIDLKSIVVCNGRGD